MKKVISTEKKPIKLWLDDIEEGALKQAKNLANLPFIFKHIAILPDCLTDNTEVLTSDGFVFIKDLSYNDLICNYDQDTRKTFFSNPQYIINRRMRAGEVVYGFTNCNNDKQITVSENHRMPLLENMGEMAKNVNGHTKIKDYAWGGGGNICSDYDISDELLCLVAWIVGDGNVKKSNKRSDGLYSSLNIRFGLTKERKILRVQNLLCALGIRHSTGTTEKQTTISVMVKESRDLVEIVGIDKEYPVKFISGLSTRQALLFLEECIKVDGDWENYQNYGSIRYNSSRKRDVDFLSALISIHVGIACDNTRFTEGYKRIKMHYLSSISNGRLIESGNGMHEAIVSKSVVEYNGNLVCVTCDSGFFIARQNGMTFVTGNCHKGYGMPIGAVMATDGVVIPHAVGFDIGCGMCAVKTGIHTICKNTIKRIMGGSKEFKGGIRSSIPVGRSSHSKRQDEEHMPKYALPGNTGWPVVRENYLHALKQVGTLGSGNHFIELQQGDDGYAWIMIHSGSRNLGYAVANHYDKLAVDLNRKWHTSVPEKWQLAFLPLDSQAGQDYLEEMQYCVDFALSNRRLMMKRTQEAITEAIGETHFGEMINVAHNYATMENHFGKNVMIHRKGATSARAGQLGIIPGSQGTASYIVQGKGEPESFMSCSHGAGRKMSRTRAQAELDLEGQQKILDDIGVVHGMRSARDLDEAPGAYKDISVVMGNQSDLVDIAVELKPLAVVKG